MGKENEQNPVYTTIEITGGLLTIAGIVALFLKEFYVAGSVLLCCGLVVGSILAWYHFRADRLYLNRHMYIDILDSKGHEAKVRVESDILVLDRNVTTIVYRKVSASGRIEYKGCEPGRLAGHFHEGGLSTVITVLDQPLLKGDIIKAVLHMTFWDTYCDDHESNTFMCTHKYKEIGLHVTFPEYRTCKKSRAFYTSGDKVFRCTEPLISSGGRKIDWVMQKPKMDRPYVVEWFW